MRRLLALVGISALLAGCGISAQDGPSALTSGVSSPLTSPTPLTRTEQTTIYLVNDKKLKQATRDTAPNPTAQQVLDALQAEPSAQESTSGLTTGVTGCKVVDNLPGSKPGVVTVQVPDMFLTDDNLAFGQIVLSLVRLPEMTAGVQFVRDGKPIEVPDGTGAQRDGVVTRADYSALLER